MTPNIDISDKNAWDDSLLIRSWDDAVTEYKKYHSINKSGKKLEDVLTKDELRELRVDYSDVLDEAEVASEELHSNGITDQRDINVPSTDAASETHHVGNEVMGRQPIEPIQQPQPLPSEPAATHADTMESAMPQAILGRVGDENMRNIMMSWYYAGYYTGLHAGQQQTWKTAEKE